MPWQFFDPSPQRPKGLQPDQAKLLASGALVVLSQIFESAGIIGDGSPGSAAVLYDPDSKRIALRAPTAEEVSDRKTVPVREKAGGKSPVPLCRIELRKLFTRAGWTDKSNYVSSSIGIGVKPVVFRTADKLIIVKLDSKSRDPEVD